MKLLKNKIKYSLLFSFALYGLINLFVLFQGNHFENKLESYDLNKNGFFEKNERTEKQQIALKEVSNDTARILAPFTTIPVIIILGFIFWSSLSVLEKKRLT